MTERAYLAKVRYPSTLLRSVLAQPRPIATRRLGRAECRFRRKAEMALITPVRRFPPPWTIEEHNDACFIVKDATGQALGYFYFEDEPERR